MGSPKTFLTLALDATVCSTSRKSSLTAIDSPLSDLPLDADPISPFLLERNLRQRQAPGELLVFALAMPDREQRDHAHVVGNLQRLFHPALNEAFHRRGVVADRLRHPHHGSEGDHHVAVEPHSPIRRDAHRVARWRAEGTCDDLLHLLVLLFGKSMLLRHLHHAIELL